MFKGIQFPVMGVGTRQSVSEVLRLRHWNGRVDDVMAFKWKRFRGRSGVFSCETGRAAHTMLRDSNRRQADYFGIAKDLRRRRALKLIEEGVAVIQ